jgi:hypothetical protein
VRRVLHELPSRTIENLHKPFKMIFDVHSQVPTKGLANPRWFALGMERYAEATRASARDR